MHTLGCAGLSGGVDGSSVWTLCYRCHIMTPTSSAPIVEGTSLSIAVVYAGVRVWSEWTLLQCRIPHRALYFQAPVTGACHASAPPPRHPAWPVRAELRVTCDDAMQLNATLAPLGCC